MARRALAILGFGARLARASGAGRALHTIRDQADRAFLVVGRPPLTTRVDGVELRGFLRHRSFLDDLSAGTHEPYLRQVLLSELRPESVFVDVGAHVGLYTLLAARQAREVVALEADPYTARALAWNTRGAPNVRVVARAASDHAGTVTFFRSPGTYGSSLFHRPGMAFDAIAVEATTLDAELRGAADLVAKIDAEGAELQVLSGAETTLRAAERVVLVVEVNPEALADAGSTPRALVERLRALELEIHRVDERGRTLAPLTGDETGDWKGNLLARRSTRIS